MYTTKKLEKIEKISLSISHEEFTLACIEAENYSRLNEIIRIKTSKNGDIERDRLIDHSKMILINETIKQNEKIKNNLKSQV